MNLGDVFANYNLAVAAVRRFAASADALPSDDVIEIFDLLQSILETAYDRMRDDP